MRLRHSFYAAALALPLAGCWLPFEEEYRPEHSMLNVHLRVIDPASDPADVLQLMLDGQLYPEQDSRGRSIAVEDARLQVGDRAVEGVRQQSAYIYQAQWQVPRAAAGESILTLRPPTVRGVQPSLQALRFRHWSRVGGPELTIGPGEDAVLRVQASGAPSGNVPPTWALQVLRSGQSFQMSGSGTPPTTLRLPRENLPTAGTGPYAVVLTIFQSIYPGDGPAAGRYLVGAQVTHELRWTIRPAAGG